ncbi:MAG: hypothetical protein JSV86_16845 [Gemmatimonadota bacterium]|nr:MAG: hypothetical protein JSV86_16845 [Gemmatimonadota bacterium]
MSSSLLATVCERYETRGQRVMALSEVAAMAATQNIDPEDLLTPEQVAEFFETLSVIGQHSRDIPALQPKYDAMASPLGTRWRKIRAAALAQLLDADA